MLTKKSVDIFDVTKIKPGYFITYTERLVDWESDENGDEIQVYDETEPINEMVKKVNEEHITTIDIYSEQRVINISDLIPEDEETPPLYKILGIRASAI